MIKGLSEAAAIALSLVAVVGPAEAIGFPDQCWPNCYEWQQNLQCEQWFGFWYYYCGWNNGWTYCCA
jgi:hypothetical protein